MTRFEEHIRDNKPGFICYPAGGREAPDFKVEVNHLFKAGAKEESLQLLREKFSGDISELIAFYKLYNGVELYRQDDMPSIEFFTIESMDERNEEWQEWFDMMEEDEIEEELFDFQKNGIAFGEVTSSGNYFVWHEGKVYYSSHDGEVEEPIADSFNQFLDLIAKDPASLLYDLGCYTRFSDGKTDIQWIPKEYVSG